MYVRDNARNKNKQKSELWKLQFELSATPFIMWCQICSDVAQEQHQSRKCSSNSELHYYIRVGSGMDPGVRYTTRTKYLGVL